LNIRRGVKPIILFNFTGRYFLPSQALS